MNSSSEISQTSTHTDYTILEEDTNNVINRFVEKYTSEVKIQRHPDRCFV